MPKVRWDGDASNVLREQEKMVKGAEKYAQSLRDGAKSASSLEKAAVRIKEAIDPQQKLNRLYAELGQHVKAGRLTIEQATAAGVKFRQELGLTAAQAKRVGESTAKAFGSQAVAALSSYLAGIVSIGGAISLIRTELDAVAALSERSALKTIDVAQAEAQLRETIAGDPGAGNIIKAARELAELRKLPLAQVFTAMEQAFAAGGDAALAVETVTEATRQTRAPERLVEAAAGIGDIIQSTTIKDAEEAAGFLALLAQTSRIRGEKVAAAGGKVAAAFVSPTAGGTEAAAAATLSALSVAGVDPEGDRARTAAIQLIDKSREFFDKNRRQFGISADDVDTIDERLKTLLAPGNRQIAEQFVRETNFEAVMQGAISSLFLSDNTRDLFNRALLANDSAGERIAAARARAKFISEGPLQAAAQTNQAIDAIVEGLDLSKSDGGILTKERRDKFITTIAEATGASILGTRLETFVRTGATLTRREAIQFGETILNDPVQRDPNATGVRALREMVDGLRQIERNQRAQVTTRAE